MEKTFLEKKIKDMAKSQVNREWKEFVNEGYKKFGQLKINNKYLFGGDSSGHGNTFKSHLSYWLDDMLTNETDTNSKEVLDKRIKEVEEELTKKLLHKVESLSYLFNGDIN